MQTGNNPTSITGQALFPGATAFEEVFDIGDDEHESGNILSFDSLREAFTAIHHTETKLAETMHNIELSANDGMDIAESPEYDTENDNVIGMVSESIFPWPSAETSSGVGVRLETIIEAMLFVSNHENSPLAAEQIAEKLREVSVEDVEHAVAYLNKQYEMQHCPYTIIKESGGYRMLLRSEFEPVRSNFYGKIRTTRLSQQAVDTLAVVAYRQPITAEEIQFLRRQSCTGILSQLVRRKLLRTTREVQEKKSTVHYHTTHRFLELLRIQSISELPSVDELC